MKLGHFTQLRADAQDLSDSRIEILQWYTFHKGR
jgi:hypothetical protein